MGVVEKLYAAYRSGCLKEDRLAAYYPFFASLIYNKGWETIDEEKVRLAFEEKYEFSVPATFVRQVLGSGIENGSIVYNHGEYCVDRIKMREHSIQTYEFDKKWKRLVDDFRHYCKLNDFSLDNIDVENELLILIELNDADIVSGNGITQKENDSRLSYIWGRFVDTQADSNKTQFDFIVAISLSSILKQAIFLSEDYQQSYDRLTIFLDSPIVFALLGMDSKDRVESCRMLVQEAVQAGCSVQILDNNFHEVQGIINRSSVWVLSDEYDVAKANKVSTYLHDSELSREEILDEANKVEERLNSIYSVSVRETNYDVYEHCFQEDESKLIDLIKTEYKIKNQVLTEEKLQSIKTDVRSIVMVYRVRQGQTSITISESGFIMLSMNGAIANACIDYEAKMSINSGHIPACITADLFGAILWLSRPATLMEYKRHQLLADCFSATQPNQAMLKKYIESLKLARDAGDIDEKKFLFLRSHPVARDALMNVTKGDYSKFSQRTYQEVYDEIVAISEKKFIDEQNEHEETKKRISKLENELTQRNTDICTLKEAVASSNKLLLEIRREAIAKKSSRIGITLTFLIVGIPVLICVGLIEVYKSTLTEFKIISYITSGVATLSEIPIIASFNKTKKKITNYFINKLEEKDKVIQEYADM